MRKMLLAAGVAIAALSLPAFAQDHGHGGGGGVDHVPAGPPTTIPASPNANDRASGQVTGDVRAQTDSHASDRAQTRTGASVDRSHSDADTTTTVRTDTDADDDDRAATGAGNVVTNTQGNKFGGAACAPGLAGRDPACVPPGQANKTFRVGQHLSGKYKYYTDLSSIPQDARTQVPTQYRSNDYRYIYQTDRIYVVNRDTNTVATVINLGG